MDSKSWISAWRSVGAAAGVAILVILGGCALIKDGNHPGGVFTRVGGHGGQIIEPKRCLLKVVILSRPFGDPVVRDVIWRVADEQVVPPPVRRALEANGFRLGRIIGALPGELEAILEDTSPQNRVSPASLFVADGDSSLIRISESVDEASLLVNKDNRAFGRDYRDASGFFRVIAQHEGPSAVTVRLVPEIQHGPIQRNFQVQPNAVPLAPQEFQITSGQQEETMRELAASVLLEPNQLVVVGCRPEQKRSLGSFMLTQAVAHSDQRLEKLVLIWASRNLEGQGANDGSSTTSDRPKILERFFGPLPKTAGSKPAAPDPVIPLPDRITLPDPAAGLVTTPPAAPAQATPKPAAPGQSNAKPAPAADPDASGKDSGTP